MTPSRVVRVVARHKRPSGLPMSVGTIAGCKPWADGRRQKGMLPASPRGPLRVWPGTLARNRARLAPEPGTPRPSRLAAR